MEIARRSINAVIGLILFSIIFPAIADDKLAAPTANSRYVIKGGEVYDQKSNLTWQRCSVGQRWAEGTQCVGLVKTFTFDEAQRQGDGTWRVPTKKKLVTLIDRNRNAAQHKTTIDEIAFPNMDLASLRYWTSTSYDATDAWFVDFGVGDIDYLSNYGRSGSYAVRLVRSGK